VKGLVYAGAQEVVITGTNIGDYGLDWHTQPLLDELLERILGETDLKRLRVSSLDPTEITPRMLNLVEKDPRFCPHFHVSVQSPHGRILRLMKRKYRAEEVSECLFKLSQLHAPLGGVFVGMDLITGFPGETQQEFEWSYQTLAQLPWTRMHVFPYSEREGTPATRLPGTVLPHVRSQRAKLLNELSLNRLKQHYQTLLTQCRENSLSLQAILMEKGASKGWASGYTPNYLRVLIPESSAITKNELIDAIPYDLMVDRGANDVAFVAKKRTTCFQ
jgi:threonylcarbamoyladenosine tRNA methylthiotransferase MtaB